MRRKIEAGLIGSMFSLAASSALAADLPAIKAPPPPPPVFSWQGPYLGIYAGA
jgi:outer membrane immunogenic protein